ncbi:MAG: tetratricopeptide repeat protein, partial [Myxococcales bacterium]
MASSIRTLADSPSEETPILVDPAPPGPVEGLALVEGLEPGEVRSQAREASRFGREPPRPPGLRSRRARLPVPALLFSRAALVALAVAFAAPAAGDSGPDAARAVVGSAQRAYDLGLFEQALLDYHRAYELDPQPALLFNIGQCHRKLGELERAAHFYRRFVALAPDSVNATLARDLADEVEALVAGRKRAAREESAQRRRVELAKYEAMRAQAAARALAQAALEARRLTLTPAA